LGCGICKKASSLFIQAGKKQMIQTGKKQAGKIQKKQKNKKKLIKMIKQLKIYHQQSTVISI
jgi:hypothetical protein